MDPTTELEASPAAMRVILVEMVSGSEETWNDGLRQVLERASETDRLLEGLDVLHTTAVIRDGRVVAYHLSTRFGVADPTVSGAGSGNC